MRAGIRSKSGCVGLLLVVLLVGCGKSYKVTFTVDDVINAWGDDVTAEALDVDLVCLTKETAERHPSIVRGTLKADKWFHMRDQDDDAIGDIPASCIYALRYGNAGDKRDTLVGPPLLSAVDRKDHERTTTITVHHPDPGKAESAIVIYGRFSSRDGIARTPPLVIRPLPRWDDNIEINVGRHNMVRTH